jgi:aminopeptidase
MRDGRVDSLARILVEYSTAVKEGDVVVIQGSSAGEPLIHSVYEHVLTAGGHPIVQMSFEGQQATYLSRASDTQLQWVSPPSRWAAEEADVSIAIGADLNTRELSQVPPERQMKRRAATKDLMEIVMDRAAKGEHRWVYTLLPTHAYASDAEMSLEQFESFYFRACLTHDSDPVTAWKRHSAETERLCAWIQGHSEVRRQAQHARRRVLHGADRGLRRGRGELRPPVGHRRPRGRRRAAALRGRKGRRRERRAR